MQKNTVLLTFSFNYNYGAILQTYAMTKALEELNIATSIPSYVPSYLKGNASFFRGIGLRQNGLVGAIIKRLKQYKRYQAFDEFRSMYLPVDKSLSSLEVIKSRLNDFDSVIVGSDQTWNTNWMSDFESYYFQGFFDAGRGTKKISYASCFGKAEQPQEFLPKIRDCLAKFDSLAVRNNMSADVVKNLIQREPAIVVDPTLLHDFSDLKRAEWSKELDIILVYSLAADNLKNGQNLAEQLKTKYGSKIVFINGEKPHEISWADELLNDAGPMTWLELFMRARFIVTDSFHGCVFATKFRKQFVPYTKGWRAGRIVNFLDTCGLSDLLVKDDHLPEVSESYWDNADFDKALAILKMLRSTSLDYLKCSHE